MRSHHPLVPVPQTHVSTPMRASLYDAAINAGAQITYNGGPLISNVELYLFYWGDVWSNDPNQTSIVTQIEPFVSSFVGGSDLDRLAEYSVANYVIGRGALMRPGFFINGPAPASVKDSDVQTAVQKWVTDYNIVVTPNTLCVVLTPPGTQVTSSWGGKSCGTSPDDFTGYHSDIAQGLFYAIVAQCPQIQNTVGLTAVDYFRCVLSHEICEAITDPVFQTGWYSDDLDEVGDPCAWKIGRGADGGVIQKLWSNKVGGCS